MQVFTTLKPGMFTTIQDKGRYGYLRFGVPVSGAMDTFSMVVANALVGNDAGCACLETTLIGPELQALTEIQIAICGGNCAPLINGHHVSMWRTLNICEGDNLSFGSMESGCRAYVAVRGGIDSPLLLGSRSTYVRGGFGGIDGRQLKTGDIIKSLRVPALDAEYSLPEELTPRFPHDLLVQVIQGPQAGTFTDEGAETLLSGSYKVTSDADRMGYRLEGPPIEHKDKADIVSDALLPGAVQVPGNKQPIIIMKDAQTTGGYPKVAVVATFDLDVLGQAKPTDRVQFSKTTVKRAHENLKQYRLLLDKLAAELMKEPV
jgi:biotin-dependent carboxylase-like uncharacterized protein